MVAETKLKSKTTTNTSATYDTTSNEGLNRLQCLRILKAILTDDPEHVRSLKGRHQEPPKRPRSANNIVNAPAQRRKASKNDATKTKNGAKFILHEDTNIASIPYGQAEQRRYASSAFNSNLKILNALVRKKQERQARRACAPSGRLSPIQATTQPLGEIVDNNITKTTEDAVETTGSVHEIGLAADCASAALGVLRKLDEEHNQPNDASQKRETGALVFLDRLISLELAEKALIEASRIHEHYGNKRNQNWKRTISNSLNAVVTLSQLLSHKENIDNHRDFHLIASLQSQLLRLSILYHSQLDLAVFVQLVREDNSVGPAAVIEQAFHAELINRKEAASHLGTISQAISKLYAAAIRDPNRDSSSPHLFDLFVQTQLLRIKSWHYTNHQPHLQTDLWPALNSALTRLWKSPDSKVGPSLAKYDLSTASLRILQQRLDLADLPSDLPRSINTLLADLADLHNDSDKAITMLESLVETSTDHWQLVFKWRLLAMLLHKEHIEIPKLQPLLQSVKASMELHTLSASVREHQIVLTAVHLRKSICTFLANLSTQHHNYISSVSDITTSSIDIMSGVLRCILLCFTNSQQDQYHAYRTALLKTVDAAVDLERFLSSNDVGVIDQYIDVLDVCFESINTVVGTATIDHQANAVSVVAPLAVKVSNALWRQHSKIAANDQDLKRAIKLAEQAIDMLCHIPTSSLQGAALGPKLENLSKLHSRSGAAHASQICRRRAAEHYIASGALQEAVERALCCSSGQIWTDSGSLSCQLARCVRNFLDNATSQVNQCDSLTIILDDETLLPEARFVLLELQILHLLCTRTGSDVIVAAREALSQITSLCSENEHYIWHARLYSQILFHASKTRDFQIDTWLPVEMLQRVVQACEKQATSALCPWAPCLRSLLCLQITLLNNKPTGSYESFVMEVSNICLYIEGRQDAAALEAIIDDYGCLISTLEGVADWAFAMHEDGLRHECLTTIHHINRIRLDPSSPKLFRSSVNLLDGAISVDDRRTSSELMTNIQQANYDDIPKQLQLKSLVVQAGYHISMVDFQSCESVLTLIGVSETLMDHKTRNDNTKHSFPLDLLFIDALSQSFLLYICKSMLREACQTARQAVRLTTSHWSAMESYSYIPLIVHDNVSRVKKEDVSKLNPSAKKSIHPSHQYGAHYWKLLRLHANCLRRMSVISSHQGLYSDAIYYAHKLHILARTLPLKHLLAAAESELALLYARAGGSFKVDGTLGSVKGITGNLRTSNSYLMALNYAEASFENGDTDRAKEVVLQLPDIDSGLYAPGSMENGSETPETLLKPPKPRHPVPNRTKTSSVKRPGATQKVNEVLPQVKPVRPNQDPNLVQLGYRDRVQALRYKLSLPSEIEASFDGIENYHEASLVKNIGSIHSKLARATFLYDSAMRIVSHDTVTSLLTDSAVSLPAKNNRRRISVLQGFDNQRSVNASKPKKYLGNEGLVGEATKSARTYLKQANDLLKQLRETQVHLCPSYIIHASQKLRSKINLLTASLDLVFSYTPLQIIFETIEPLGIAEDRERHFAFAEQATERTAQVREWHLCETSEEIPSSSVLCKPAELVARIPSSWQVVSIGLSEGANELHIARVIGGSTSPFMIQLPVSRSNEGDGTDEYTFTQAKRELGDIIKQANKTAHEEGGHDHNNKQRQAWNKQRESLNARLEAWLTDIDNIWMGGFRGVFSPFQFDEKLVTRFGRTMTRILHKYLPSRQKNTMQEDQVDIHCHVLELFLGLGDLDPVDLDNAIMDLLYFVVDILQSSGERNAYDEIDWDNMLVDVLDAINGFHANADLAEQQPRHTILILDKELMCFPWENLPCLRDQPISRMPSLNALYHRIQLIRQQATPGAAFHVSKDNHKGAYILNPAGDLPGTQSTFEALLNENDPTSTYASLVSTAPTESQFTSYLTESQILLYFGHGSGAQYIRGRHIRSLCLRGTDSNDGTPKSRSTGSNVNSGPAQEVPPQIATTFLLGCSSAALTTHGKYEPHGPPGWYMLAGAPALVGTLWDVTDRDIDRFAVKTLAEWGLVDAAAESVVGALEKSERARSKREEREHRRGGGKKQTRVGLYQKNKETEEESGGSGVPLDEAVRRAREVCLLRWLNGASVVVYGCPVVIDD